MTASHEEASAPLTRKAALACIPVRSSQIIARQMDDGLVRITYPAQVKPWRARLARLFSGQPHLRRPMRKLELDRLGSFVWQAIDERRSVRQIIAHFAAAQRLSPREAEVSVTQFLRELGKRGIVGMRAAP